MSKSAEEKLWDNLSPEGRRILYDDFHLENMPPQMLRMALIMREAWNRDKLFYCDCIQVLIDSIEGRDNVPPELLKQRDDLQDQLDQLRVDLEAAS